MGSRSKITLAYIAGFLDGDGSLMLQLKKRPDGKQRWRFMATVCFYQDSRHERNLAWIRKHLGIGYLSRRNDGMSELRVNGFKQIKEILRNLLPFIRFKKVQAQSLYKAASLLDKKRLLTRSDLLKIIGYINEIQANNYASRHKRTRSELMSVLDLTP